MQHNPVGAVGNYRDLKAQARERRKQRYEQYRAAYEAEQNAVMTGQPETQSDPAVNAPRSEDPIEPQVHRISSDVDPTPRNERELARVKTQEDAATIVSNIPPEVARQMQPQHQELIQDDKTLQRIISDADPAEFEKVYNVTLKANPDRAARLLAARIRDIELKAQHFTIASTMLKQAERQRGEAFLKPIIKAHQDIDEGVIRDFAVQTANANPQLFEAVVRGSPAQVQQVRDWFVGQLQQRRHQWAAALQPRESATSGLTVAIKERKARRRSTPKGSGLQIIGN